MPEYKVVVKKHGTFWYNKEGQSHREDGPAIEFATGAKQWFQNGKRHRTTGPAIERVNGDKYWYQNNELHREDGPAIEYADGREEYWIAGKRLTKGEFNRRTPSCDGKVVEVDGKKYKLTFIEE